MHAAGLDDCADTNKTPFLWSVGAGNVRLLRSTVIDYEDDESDSSDERVAVQETVYVLARAILQNVKPLILRIEREKGGIVRHMSERLALVKNSLGGTKKHLYSRSRSNVSRLYALRPILAVRYNSTMRVSGALLRTFAVYLLLAVAPCDVDAIAARAEKNEKATAASAKNDRAEKMTFHQDGRQRAIEGRVVTEAADGGLLLEANDGVLWTIERDELVSRKPLDSPFESLTDEQLAERLLAELPGGFRVHTTPHYVVCYNTSRAYALWTSSLLERLYKAFTNYWRRQDLEIREPEFPLPIIVFADPHTYDQASRRDLPGGTGVLRGAGGIVGYYSLRSNRVNMFDLTGAEALYPASERLATARRGSLREINQMLSKPAAVPLVATIVHEATHQIAFNCGLQTRYADIPLWLCEGMAVYFEAPDLSSTRGWRGIGKVNYARLERFRHNLPNWRDDSLESLLATDHRFRNPRTAVDAYADAWALNYYLIKYESDAYADYLKTLSEKRPLLPDDPSTRLAEFRRHFGNLDRLQHEFLKQMSRVK
jgi:hypothetical protein